MTKRQLLLSPPSSAPKWGRSRVEPLIPTIMFYYGGDPEMVNCKDCGESFEARGRERICPDCRVERATEAEEARKMRKQPRY